MWGREKKPLLALGGKGWFLGGYKTWPVPWRTRGCLLGRSLGWRKGISWSGASTLKVPAVRVSTPPAGLHVVMQKWQWPQWVLKQRETEKEQTVGIQWQAGLAFTEWQVSAAVPRNCACGCSSPRMHWTLLPLQIPTELSVRKYTPWRLCMAFPSGLPESSRK